jgi:hypothetical protein
MLRILQTSRGVTIYRASAARSDAVATLHHFYQRFFEIQVADIPVLDHSIPGEYGVINWRIEIGS